MSTSHTVQSGDTLWAIARQNQTTVDDLVRANPQLKDPNKIYPGQVLTIPDHRDDSPTPRAPASTAPEAAGLTPDGPDSADIPAKTLRFGARGPEVRFLQSVLEQAGYATGPIDGFFGPLTRGAVLAFQRARGLVPDGIVGPKTWAALAGTREPEEVGDVGAFTPPSRTLRQGARGVEVTLLQRALDQVGFSPGPIDGDFGPVTESAVRSFQRAAGLVVDGIVGPRTWAALATVEVPEPPPDLVLTPPDSTPGQYDGTSPAEGTVAKPWSVIEPPFTNSPDNRSPAAYNDAINQFAVGMNSRYGTGTTGPSVNDGDADVETLVSGSKTYCNIFAWDVTTAMGVEMPHYYDPDTGEKATPGAPGTLEMSVTRMVDWMNTFGPDKGWVKVSAEEAQNMANEGHPTLVMWDNPTPGRSGHVSVVRPGEGAWHDGQFSPSIAQAGRYNDNYTDVLTQFGSRSPLEYWVCSGTGT